MEEEKDVEYYKNLMQPQTRLELTKEVQISKRSRNIQKNIA